MATTKKTQKLQAKLDTLRKYGVLSAIPLTEQKETDGVKENVITEVTYSEKEVEAIAKSRGKSAKEFLALIDEEVNASIKGDDETPLVPESEPQLDTIPSEAQGLQVDPNAMQEELKAQEAATAEEEKNAGEAPVVGEEAQPAPVIIEPKEEPKAAPKTVNKKPSNKR